LHYFLLIYYNNKLLHVSSRLAAHHQEDQLCINSKWYMLWDYVYWLLAGSCQQPVNITLDYTSCCLNRVDPPDDEQQACSKHVEAYYYNKLIENSASFWFISYGYITMHDQQNFKNSFINISIKYIRINYKSLYCEGPNFGILDHLL